MIFIKNNFDWRVNMKLKYFDDSTEETYELNKRIEHLWVYGINSYFQTSEPWNLEKIHEIIGTIQEYFYLGEQETWLIDSSQLRSALDDLGRVSLCLCEHLKKKATPDKGHLDYMTKKLISVLIAIDKDLRYNNR
jgi:hypothetical protein